MTKQIDCEWKARWSQGGAHIHVALFVRERGQVTWQNTGSITIGENQFTALAQAWPNVDFQEHGQL